MNFDIRTISCFDRKVKRLSKKYKSFKNDLALFSQSLAKNPFQGVDLGRGVRKVRMAISDKGKGKSGGARVITYTVKVDESSGQVTLLAIYDKNEQDSIDSKEIESLLREID